MYLAFRGNFTSMRKAARKIVFSLIIGYPALIKPVYKLTVNQDTGRLEKAEHRGHWYTDHVCHINRLRTVGPQSHPIIADYQIVMVGVNYFSEPAMFLYD